MNTNTLKSAFDWSASKPANHALTTTNTRVAGVSLQQVIKLGTRVLLAALSALAIVVTAAWAVSAFEIPSVLQAAVWASGFVFLALAIETKSANFGALLASGLAMLVLAILSAQVATEFAVIAAILVAAWVANSILKSL